MTVAANVWAADPTNKNLDPNRQLVALWERETGLSYVRTLFPNVYRRHPEEAEKIKLYAQRSSSTEPCRPLIDRENAVSEVPYPSSYGDANWLLKVFLDQWHPKEGEMNGGTTDIWGAEPTNIWIPLLE
jgi:hypothetical protein